MAVPYQPQNISAEQTDGNVLISWSASLNAASYTVLRGTDGTTFASIATGLTTYQYVDPYPGIGIQFFYKVIAVNGTGNSPDSSIVFAIPAPPGEMSLYELRLRTRQKADRLDSAFVTNSELNFVIRESLKELYDIQITAYEDYSGGKMPFVLINTQGTNANGPALYDLPNGVNYLGGIYQGTTGLPAKASYKLRGIDLGVNTSNNAWVTIAKFNFRDRNAFVYPNSTSTIYGVYNMRARVMGNQLMVIPTPAGNQQMRLWYAPILPGLLKDTDLTEMGINGYLEYAIVRAAKYILDKEESDTNKLDAELMGLKTRIEQASQNREDGSPDTISDSRRDPIYGGGYGDGGGNGGW